MGDFRWVLRGTLTWERMWKIISNKFGDSVCSNPHNGEVWQYMGSVVDGPQTKHQFRHRSLASQNNERVDYNVELPTVEVDFEHKK